MHKNKSNDIFTQAQVNATVNRCSKIEFNGMLSDKLGNILNLMGQKKGVTREFFMPAIVCSVGFYLSGCTIEAFPDEYDTPCMYSALVALASTGKSGAQAYVKNSFSAIEKYYNTLPSDSHISQTPTIESLLDLLVRLISVIAYYDEGGTYFGSIGKYGGGNGSYERGIYLTLWSALSELERDLKNDRTKIYNPRFQLCLNTHPLSMMTAFWTERFSLDEGFSHRFLLTCADPIDITANDIRRAKTPPVALVSIFLFIKLLHTNQRNYSYTIEATALLDQQFDKYKRFVRMANTFDSFIGGLCGKNFTHLVRLTMILQALEFAVASIENFPDVSKNSPTSSFENACIEFIHSVTPNAFLVELKIVQQAIHLLNYFQIHKLILSQYTVDPAHNFEEAIEAMITKNSSSTSSLNTDAETIHLMKRTLLTRTSCPSLTQLAGGNVSSGKIGFAFETLEKYGLGKVILKRAKNNKDVQYFQKTNSDAIKYDQTLGAVVQSLGVDLNKYIANLSATEIMPSQSTKRTRDENDDENNSILNQNENKKKKPNLITVVNNKNGLPTQIDGSQARNSSVLPKNPSKTQNQSHPINQKNSNVSHIDENSHILMEGEMDLFNNSTVMSKSLYNKSDRKNIVIDDTVSQNEDLIQADDVEANISEQVGDDEGANDSEQECSVDGANEDDFNEYPPNEYVTNESDCSVEQENEDFENPQHNEIQAREDEASEDDEESGQEDNHADDYSDHYTKTSTKVGKKDTLNSQNTKIKKYVVTNSESASIFQHKNKNQNVAKKTCPENRNQNNMKSVSGTNEKVMVTQNNQPALKHVNKKQSNIQSEAPKSTAPSNKSSTAINKKQTTKTPNQEVSKISSVTINRDMQESKKRGRKPKIACEISENQDVAVRKIQSQRMTGSASANSKTERTPTRNAAVLANSRIINQSKKNSKKEYTPEYVNGL